MTTPTSELLRRTAKNLRDGAQQLEVACERPEMKLQGVVESGQKLIEKMHSMSEVLQTFARELAAEGY